VFEKRVANPHKVATTSLGSVARDLERLARTEGSWFDGTLSSIESRGQELFATLKNLRALLHDPKLDTATAARLQAAYERLEETKRVLAEVEREFIEADYQEQLQSLPEYSVMAANANTPRLGEQVEPKSQKSRSTVSTNWQKFCALEPKRFVSMNESALASENEMRARAVDYVVEVTSSVDNDIVRSRVIDTFVTNVERERRSQVRGTREASVQATSRVADLDDSALFL